MRLNWHIFSHYRDNQYLLTAPGAISDWYERMPVYSMLLNQGTVWKGHLNVYV